MRVLLATQTSGVRLFLLLLGMGALVSSSSFSSKDLEASYAPGGPQISCEETTASWGELIKGTPFEHTFKIHNNGDEVLIIQKVNGT